MADILRYIPHFGFFDFLIEDIFFIFAQIHLDGYLAITFSAHIGHFLSKLPYPAGIFFGRSESFSQRKEGAGSALTGVRGSIPLQAHLRHFPTGEMTSKCGCVMTHPMLGILLANPFGFAGSDCHRAGGFEPITPYPAIAFMLLYCGEYKGKIKNCHSTGARVHR